MQWVVGCRHQGFLGAGIGEVVGMGKVARIRDEQMMHALTVGAGLSRGAGMSRRNGDYWGHRH